MTKENLEKRSKLGKVRKLTPEENKKMIDHHNKVIQYPIFRELQKWRAESLHSPIIINSACHSPSYVPTPSYACGNYSF